MFAQKRFFMMLPVIVLVSSASLTLADVPPDPYAEVTVATEGPLSLFCTPSGDGNPLTQAFNQSGQKVDGTITMILYDNPLPYGIPVPFFPKEDIWLFDDTSGFVACIGGTIPDADTDADGMTYWAGPLYAAGKVETDTGNLLAIMAAGYILGEGMLADFNINSSDFNVDGAVNLTDIQIFSGGYFGPYAYANDLHWDGAVNLSDLALLAGSVGDHCP